MPACSHTKANTQRHNLLWHISEPEAVLLQQATPETISDAAYQRIAHARRRREWLATRVALQHLLAQLGHKPSTLHKDEKGKPYLAGSDLHVSLAHCAAYAYVAVAQGHAIGVDIQAPRTSLPRLQRRFLQDREMAEGMHSPDTLCIYWSAKEAIYKAYGGGKGIFLRDIYVKPFVTDTQGTLMGDIHAQPFEVSYRWHAGHVLTWSRPAGQVSG